MKYNLRDAQVCGVERCLSQGCRAKIQKILKIQKYNVKDAQFCGVERCLSQGCRAKREEFRTGP